MLAKTKPLSSILIVFLVFALLAGFISASPASAKPKGPKYVIVMISDGMGYNHTLATSYYQYGQEARQV